MTVPIQIPSWLKQPEFWRFIGFVSSIIGLLCYALSSSFNHLFGKWNTLKVFLYSGFSFIICFMVLFAKMWQHSTSLRFKAHSAFLALTLTSVYSFFFDKVVNGKPDAYSLISCAAFAIMSLSLSTQTQFGFEVDFWYFFLGCLIVQLMKIKVSWAIVGLGFSYALIILRSSLDAMPHEHLGVQDEHNVIIEVDSRQVSSNTDIASVRHRLIHCMKELQQGNSNLTQTLVQQMKEYFQGKSELVMTDHNFVIDALPSETINELHKTVKLMVSLGLEKECTAVYVACRREWLEDCLINNLLDVPNIRIVEHHENTQSQLRNLTRRWSRVCIISLRILFPGERRLCDHVFSGYTFTADICFAEVCHGLAIQLLKFADAVASGSPSKWRLCGAVNMFETLRNLMPDFLTLFPKWLANEAVLTQNRLGEASRDFFMEAENFIFRVPEAKAVAPADGGLHPLTFYVIDFVSSICLSRQTMEQIFQEYPTVAIGTETFSFSEHMERKMDGIMKLLERKLIAKSKAYKDPALRYFFMMNNRRRIENSEEIRKWRTIFGKDWFQKNSTKVFKNLENYQRSSWNKVLSFLELEHNITELMKDQLNLFNKNFKEICSVQSSWYVFDMKLREQIITSLESTLLPAYGNFIGKFQDVLGKHAYEYIQYGMLDIQDLLNRLFLRGMMNNQGPKVKE